MIITPIKIFPFKGIIMSLSNLLSKQIVNRLSDDGGSWRQFILDHLDYIKNRSQTYVVDEQTANQYRYNFDQFLEEKLERRTDISWIALLLNDLPNDFSFVDRTNYIIPSDDLINNLYLSYTTIQANAR